MFGHHDDQSSQSAGDDTSNEPFQNTHDVNGFDQPVASAATAPAGSQQSVSVSPLTSEDPNWQHPGTPIDDTQKQVEDLISPAGGFPKKPSFQYAAASDSTTTDSATPATTPPAPAAADGAKGLIDIKQQALHELSPLIDKLDQTPEEKFRTLMMMIQASDDQGLIKAAYAAAHSITDEKARAQALLDIVNEINYFTSQPET